MVRLTTAKGQEILCDSVVRSQQFNYLFIHTNALTRVEVDQVFGDPEALTELTAVEQFEFPVTDENGETGMQAAETTRVYHGFTELDVVQKSPLIDKPGELMIYLQRPAANYD